MLNNRNGYPVKMRVGITVLGLGLAACGNSHGTEAHPNSTSPSGEASAPSNPPQQRSGHTIPEIEQFGARSFRDWRGPDGVGPTVNKGDVVQVECDVPGTPDMPASLKQGGFYETEELKDAQGHLSTGPFYIAANTFENGPMPNNNPVDLNVPKCTQTQLAALALNGVTEGANVYTFTFGEPNTEALRAA